MPHSDIHKKKLKKNLVVLAIVLLIIAAIWFVTMIKISSNANAQPIQQCGSVEIENIAVNDDHHAFCDIYTRQERYAAGHERFREQLNQRRENFNAPRARALQNAKARRGELNE